MHRIPELLGKGLYSPREAARLVGISTSRVRRWLKGYRFRYTTRLGKKLGVSRSVITSDLPRVRKQLALSFLELVEIYVVSKFLQRGVSMKTVRKAYDRAAQKLGVSHPFALKKFKTDGKRIFLELGEDTNNRNLLLEFSRAQFAFPQIMADYLEQVEFDPKTQLARQWWPLGRNRRILIDPGVAFGSPVIAGTRIPVISVSNAIKAGETKRSASEWFDIPLADVKAAMAFQARYAA